MSASAREATDDYSKHSQRSRERRPAVTRPPAALLLLAVAGALLLAISEVLPLYEVVVGSLEEQQRTEPGWQNHGFAMLLMALASVPMIRGARRGARPAMLALMVIGAIAVLIVVTVDYPAVRQQAELREAAEYEDARAKAATGFYVESLGAVLLLASGGLMVLAPRRQARTREREREPRERAAPAEE